LGSDLSERLSANGVSEESRKDDALNGITSLPDADGVSITMNNVSKGEAVQYGCIDGKF